MFVDFKKTLRSTRLIPLLLLCFGKICENRILTPPLRVRDACPRRILDPPLNDCICAFVFDQLILFD